MNSTISLRRKVRLSLVTTSADGADIRPTATLPFIFIFYLFYDLAYTPMLIAYTLEILPFTIRAKGFAVMVSSTWHSR